MHVILKKVQSDFIFQLCAKLIQPVFVFELFGEVVFG
jgi:hypothetical protein